MSVTLLPAAPKAASELAASTPPRMSTVCPAPPNVLTARSSRVPGPDLIRPKSVTPSSMTPVRMRPEFWSQLEAVPTEKWAGPLMVVVPVTSRP